MNVSVEVQFSENLLDYFGINTAIIRNNIFNSSYSDTSIQGCNKIKGMALEITGLSNMLNWVKITMQVDEIEPFKEAEYLRVYKSHHLYIQLKLEQISDKLLKGQNIVTNTTGTSSSMQGTQSSKKFKNSYANLKE